MVSRAVRHAGWLWALASVCGACGGGATEILGEGNNPALVTLSATRADDGKTLSLAVHQRVAITLQTIGPGSYGDPTLSSKAVRFLGMLSPAEQNPGGPTQIYSFEGVAPGAADVQIPHTVNRNGSNFTVRLVVE